MQIFRITLSDGARKFHTQFLAPDAAFAEIKAAYHFDTSRWKILTIARIGVASA